MSFGSRTVSKLDLNVAGEDGCREAVPGGALQSRGTGPTRGTSCPLLIRLIACWLGLSFNNSVFFAVLNDSIPEVQGLAESCNIQEHATDSIL